MVKLEKYCSVPHRVVHRIGRWRTVWHCAFNKEQLQMVNHVQDMSSKAPATGMFCHINTEWQVTFIYLANSWNFHQECSILDKSYWQLEQKMTGSLQYWFLGSVVRTGMHCNTPASAHTLFPTERQRFQSSRGAHECIMKSLQDLACTRTIVSARAWFLELDLLDLRIAPVVSSAVSVG